MAGLGVNGLGIAEAIGTMVLVLLGDGVVANVLLTIEGTERRVDRSSSRVGHGR